jgi:uncharacterized protein YecE (DUF72 family)
VARAFIGTSGWIYDHWKGAFYPPGLPPSRWLAYNVACFGTVEINGTFYRLQRPECFERWRAEAPRARFAMKASRYVTHMLKLGGGRAPLGNFFAQGVLHLGKNLGPILWQLPPRLRFSVERAEPFFAALPRTVADAERVARAHDHRLDGRAALRAPDGRRLRLRHALEVRDESWLSEESLALLHANDIALVAADTGGRFPRSFARTASFAYARLHGARRLYASRYTDAELDEWADHIRAWLAGGADVWVYFDNDDQAHAPHDALRLQARVSPAASLGGGAETAAVTPAP